jgi:hypothetical protein
MIKNEPLELNRLKRGLLLCSAALTLSAAGCGLEPLDAPAEQAAQDEQPEALQQVVTTPNRNGVFFADVQANGTGCPPGSWRTSISDDGLVFTTTFSAYEASVNAETGVAVKDCQLAVKLHSPNGLSYSVQSFYYSGFAFLEEGVTASQTASYYFQGRRLDPAKTARTNLTGPYDDQFSFLDDIEVGDATWSECGTQRDLNINTRLRVQNTDPGKDGYINLTAIDGSSKLEFVLAFRPCPTPGGTAPTPPAGGTIRTVTPPPTL